MKNSDFDRIVISGLGITSAIGQGKNAFWDALVAGNSQFSIMSREGRQRPDWHKDCQASPFIGAEIAEFTLPSQVKKSTARTASLTGQVALSTLDEAYHEANLAEFDPRKIGLIIGGSNTQQRELIVMQDNSRPQIDFLRPNYGFKFLDSDLCGLCTEQFGIQGTAYTLGSASASGQAAVIQAAEMVRSGQVDVCIALGALMDLSYWECQAFTSMGAMSTLSPEDTLQTVAKPFDIASNGFVYGESSAALVIERQSSALKRGLLPYASVSGWATHMDAHRNPNPSLEGEITAINKALYHADWNSRSVDYVNPHGTGARLGDSTEINALASCQLRSAAINTTKAITGHGLTAAGATELCATLLQMKYAKLHPCKNLKKSIDPDFNWVGAHAKSSHIQRALNLSLGFGGINTALCIEQLT